jgi:hypothetical protein
MPVIGVQLLWSGLTRLESYLPIELYDAMRRITGRIGPNGVQLNQIELLGENIGLSKSEVHAALDPQLGSTFIDSKQRLTQFIAIFTILIIAIISVLVTWFVVDPESFPIPTYVPGSLYGSIAPRDFSVYGATAL